MALFRRNDPEPTEPPARASVASEAQAVQLRGRARRRLVGAVALVLAAVIVLPMALDSEPIPVASDIPIVIPDRTSAYQPQFAGDDTAQTAAQTTPQATQPAPPERSESSAVNPSPPDTASNTSTSATTGTTTSAAPANAAKPTPAPPQRPVATTTPARTSDATASTPTTPARTDDGSRALALLEGRASDAAANTNAYVLQIAAYTNQNDAHARRDQLIKAGVANAFVTAATVNGKPQYRLRVGPFASRADAQAAQPRLRTLGYDNGFIAAQ